MDSAELAKLCAKLSISDVDGPIRQVSGEIKSEGLKDVDHCLVGKVLAGKRVNREAFKKVIEQLWSPIGSVEIEAVGDNTFMFFFPSLEVRSLIWSRGPWHFDRNLIVLEKPTGTGDISKLSFHMVEFWVQIHNLPLMCMNRRMARYLAEQIGTVVELPTDSRECWGRFIRVKVRIDISKPLLRCLRLNLDDSGEVTTAILLYERLPEFCYACGIIGHGLRDCPDDDARLEALEGVSTKYGSWLRAASVEQSKNRNSRNEKKPDDIPPSSYQENQTAKNSDTNRQSEQYSIDHERTQQLLTALVPVSNTTEDDNRGLKLGLLAGSTPNPS
ncbi:hypothetical protein EZV62_015258 [Acer yangbiense]|uniref:CCHC-type domain-containing protein n=1 Tax=Acer yangbiense TaxID=1000413 RepID=A0A5C7HUW5_9ROSI|nr:hypothetical protein EZV62_015258 [Acer yangbiense]